MPGNFPYSTIHAREGAQNRTCGETANEAKMKSGTGINKNQDSAWYSGGINEPLLQAEISFWKDMIAGCKPSHPHESRERMQQALALAELRLATLFSDYHQACAANTVNRLPSNVYSISLNKPTRPRNSGSAEHK